jgi:hypothetical protein
MTLLTVCNNPTRTKINLGSVVRLMNNRNLIQPNVLKISNTPTGPRTIPPRWVQNWNQRLYPKVKDRTTLPRLITNGYLSLILAQNWFLQKGLPGISPCLWGLSLRFFTLGRAKTPLGIVVWSLGYQMSKVLTPGISPVGTSPNAAWPTHSCDLIPGSPWG